MPDPTPAPPPKPPTPPAAPAGPTINIGEEYGTAKKNLPPAKILLIAIAAVVVVVLIASFVKRAKPQASGSLDNVAAVEIPGQGSTMVALTFTIRNTSDKILYVHNIQSTIKAPSGDSTGRLDGALNVVDVENLVAGVADGEGQGDHGRALAGNLDGGHVVERARSLRLSALHERSDEHHDHYGSDGDQQNLGWREILLCRAVFFPDVNCWTGGRGWWCRRLRGRGGSWIRHGSFSFSYSFLLPILRLWALRLRSARDWWLRIVILGGDVLVLKPGHESGKGNLRVFDLVLANCGPDHAAAQHVLGKIPDVPADRGASGDIFNLGTDVLEMRRHGQHDLVDPRVDAGMAGMKRCGARRLEVKTLLDAVEPEFAGDRFRGFKFAIDIYFHHDLVA